MFLQAPVILLTGEGLPQCMLGYHPPGADTPLEQTPPGADTTPGSRQPPRADTRAVRILLECNLVFSFATGINVSVNFTYEKVSIEFSLM